MTTENFIQFLTENRFKEWVLNPNDTALKAFWEKWLSENTAYADEIERFKNLIGTMHQPTNFDDKAENQLWQQIQQTIAEPVEMDTDTRTLVLDTPQRWYRSWMGIAAGVALLIAGALFLFYPKTVDETLVQTTFGETKSVALPDGSEVVLNANSTIRFPKTWTVGEDREVQLKGEGYFIVNEQSTAAHKDRFIVHTTELDVEVLGTRFNVNTYRPQTQVVLQKGSVDIVTKNTNQAKKYNLKPEHCAIFNKQTGDITIAQVNSNAYVSWKDKRFVFDRTPLSEVAIMIENTYGLTVIINDKELAKKQISGEIPTSERKALLLALASLYSLKIDEQSKDTLLISK
jgi:transmembrane sensor